MDCISTYVRLVSCWGGCVAVSTLNFMISSVSITPTAAKWHKSPPAIGILSTKTALPDAARYHERRHWAVYHPCWTSMWRNRMEMRQCQTKGGIHYRRIQSLKSGCQLQVLFAGLVVGVGTSLWGPVGLYCLGRRAGWLFLCLLPLCIPGRLDCLVLCQATDVNRANRINAHTNWQQHLLQYPNKYYTQMSAHHGFPPLRWHHLQYLYL